MKLKHIFFIALLSFFGNQVWAQTADVAPNPGSGGQRALGDVLDQWDFTTVTGSILLLGVEFANGSFWVTAGGMTTTSEQNYLFQISPTGVLENTFVQPTGSTWGWRDLAFDGTFLYASDSGVIEQINMATGQATGVTIPSPENPGRALAYDPVTDHFFVGNFGSDLYEIDRMGAIINQVANGLSKYGLAWDTYSAGGPFLWAWSQDGGCTATQLDPATLLPTGTAFAGIVVPGANLAGGACISTDLITGMAALVGMHQSDLDTVVAYELTEYLAIPTLGTWGLIAFLVLLGGSALVIMRRRF